MQLEACTERAQNCSSWNDMVSLSTAVVSALTGCRVGWNLPETELRFVNCQVMCNQKLEIGYNRL
jgi:hypothetical protein